MARKQCTTKSGAVEALLAQDADLLRPLVQGLVQEVLRAQMDGCLGAGRCERSGGRLGYRSGHYSRNLVTRVGTLELRVPQDRDGRFSTDVFERYQRSEKALVAALVQMYVQGVSTRKVTAVACDRQITEALCGQSFSASTISRMNKTLDEELARFAGRRLDEEYPYLILDARYEKVREGGVVHSRAVMIAIGVNWDGRRCILAADLANRESASSWRELRVRLKQRGLHGVGFVVSDNHQGLTAAIREILPEASWQRCYVHFLRNALDYLPRKADDDCPMELRWLYDGLSLQEASEHLTAWLRKWQGKYARLCDWAEENIEETCTFYQLPRQHHKHLKSTNTLERLNQEIKRRTHVVRIFPNAESCLRLVRALAVETHEEWLEGTRYPNMEFLREHRKLQLQAVA